MNLFRELDRITQPTSASKVRTLSPREIAELVGRGVITPVERILTQGPRVSVPLNRRVW